MAAERQPTLRAATPNTAGKRPGGQPRDPHVPDQRPSVRWPASLARVRQEELHLPQVRLGLHVALEPVSVPALLLAHAAVELELLEPLSLRTTSRGEHHNTARWAFKGGADCRVSLLVLPARPSPSKSSRSPWARTCHSWGALLRGWAVGQPPARVVALRGTGERAAEQLQSWRWALQARLWPMRDCIVCSYGWRLQPADVFARVGVLKCSDC